MELRNIGGAVGGANAVNHPPVNPGAAVGRRPAFPDGQEVPTSPAGTEAAPHAAPPEKVLRQTQQLVVDALRELKLPETPLNLLIAETLRQMDQPISGANIQLVNQALRTLGSQQADDVAAAVILLMHDLPVSKENVAALRALMAGGSLPGQFAKLEGQLGLLTSQLATLEAQLATVPQNPNPAQNANPALVLNLTPPPGLIVPMQVQAAAQAADDGPAVAESGDEGTGEPEAADGKETGKSAAPNAGAGMAGMGRRGGHEPLKRALGGGVGSLGGQAGPGETAPETGETVEAAPPPADARPLGLRVNPSGTRRPGDGPPDSQNQSRHPAEGQQTPGKSGQGNKAGVPAGSAPAAGAPATASSPGPGSPAPAPAGAPGAPAPAAASGASVPALQPPAQPAGVSGTTAGGPMTPATGATPSAGTGAVPVANQGSGGTPPAALAGTQAGTPPEGGETVPTPAPLPPLSPRLQVTTQLLKGMALATTVNEPAHLGQQVEALKGLYGPLQDSLKRVGGEVYRHLQALGPLDPKAPQDTLQALARLVGRSFAGADPSPDQLEALMQLATEIHEILQQAGTTVKETVQQLHAREQISQASQVYCVPLSLPGGRSVELLIEPDEEQQRGREGGSPYRLRLAVETHHLGPVGIDVTAWQQQLRIQLQVGDARVQARLAFAQELLEKALARAGFVAPEVAVKVVAHKPQNSLLLPERTYVRSLKRIEGVV